MKSNKLSLVGLFLCLVLIPASALALGSPYELTDDSSYIEGCYDPCLCPIFMNQSLQGSFLLVFIFQDEDGFLYELSEIDWRFTQGDETISVTGTGIYERDTQQHRLILDLLVGDSPLQQFDSGLVPLPNDTPGISIAAALNGFYCYDYVFAITALPAPVEQSQSAWGSFKSTFR